MTKLQIISDCHGYLPSISKEADLLIFAGDVATTPGKVGEMFAQVRGINETAPIIYVLGNHEYYDNIYPDSRKGYKHSVNKTEDAYLLENTEATLSDISILGCTLWTDYDNQRCVAQAVFGLNDFDLITAVDKGKFRKVTPEDFINAHFESRKWLEKKLKHNKKMGIKTIVVTHHMPSFSLISSHFKGSQLNGAFAVNLDNLIAEYEPMLWVYGHTHSFKDINLGNTRCVCNAVGYRGETTHYKEKYIVEV
jgi:predicted phosphodiesterase